MIVIVYKDKIYKEQEFTGLQDPLTKGNGVAFVVTQQYVELFLLAVFPTSKKKVTAYSMATNEPIPLALWTTEMQKEADVAKAEVKGKWKLFMFWYVFFIVFGGAFIYTRAQMYSKDKDKEKQVEYYANPQVNDIVYATTFDDAGLFVSPYKIVAERGDTLLVLYSNEKEFDRLAFLDPSKTVGSFDVSADKFSNDTLKFQKKSYKERHLTPFLDKDLTRNDLIEIIYIQRPN